MIDYRDLTGRMRPASLLFCLLVPALSSLTSSFVCSQDLTGIKCVVDGNRNANPDASASFHKGKVYFCCPKCVAKFKANPKSFTTRANHQLVLTGQYQQSACPVSRGDANSKFTTSVGGTKVKFCCDKCLAKVEGTKPLPEKAEMVFGKKVFEKAWSQVTETPDRSDQR